MPVPPKSVQNAAQRALDARDSVPPSRKAGTPVGVKRASDLARGANISNQTLVRMRSYLLRAKKNYNEARNAGKSITESKAYMAYYLWGGPAALTWVNSELAKLKP